VLPLIFKGVQLFTGLAAMPKLYPYGFHMPISPLEPTYQPWLQSAEFFPNPTIASSMDFTTQQPDSDSTFPWSEVHNGHYQPDPAYAYHSSEASVVTGFQPSNSALPAQVGWTTWQTMPHSLPAEDQGPAYFPYWNNANPYQLEEAPRPRKRGRPLGSRDMVPRIRRYTKRAPKPCRVRDCSDSPGVVKEPEVPAQEGAEECEAESCKSKQEEIHQEPVTPGSDSKDA
jgi:hypothetical protein